LPDTPAGAAAVQLWLSVVAGEIAYGPNAARLISIFKAPVNTDEVIGRAHRILKRIDDQLSERQWLAVSHPTIVDLALYAYIARAPESNGGLKNYADVRA
jgi:glutathione S-transferase